jgi:hypothetical protein
MRITLVVLLLLPSIANAERTIVHREVLAQAVTAPGPQLPETKPHHFSRSAKMAIGAGGIAVFLTVCSIYESFLWRGDSRPTAVARRRDVTVSPTARGVEIGWQLRW